MWFHHRRSPTNFEILKANKGNICGGVCLRLVIGGWIGQLKFFKRNAIKDIFLIIFQNFLNNGFSNIPWKRFLEEFSWSNDFIIDLFLANSQLFQNIQRKHFSWGLYLLKSVFAVVLEKKGQFRKDFWNLQNFKTLFPFWALSECICSAIFNPVEDWRLYSCNCIKRKLHYMHFSEKFPKFSTDFKSLIKSSVTEVSRVLVCIL